MAIAIAGASAIIRNGNMTARVTIPTASRRLMVMSGEDKLLTSWQLKEDRSAFAEEALEITNNE